MAGRNTVENRILALEARVQRAEELLGRPPEPPVVTIFRRIQDLEQMVENLRKAVHGLPEFVTLQM